MELASSSVKFSLSKPENLSVSPRTHIKELNAVTTTPLGQPWGRGGRRFPGVLRLVISIACLASIKGV